MNHIAVKLFSSLVMMFGLMGYAFAESYIGMEVKKVDTNTTLTQPLTAQNVSVNKEENTTSAKEGTAMLEADVKNVTVSSISSVQPGNENNATLATPPKVETTGDSNVTAAVQPTAVQAVEVNQYDNAIFVKVLQEALADQNYDRVEEILLKNSYMIDPKTFHISPYQAYRIGEIYYLKLDKKAEAKKFIQYAAQKGNSDAVIFWDAYEIYKY